eukprot:SAG22_NODE_187_length_15860_cov_44.770446_4_plen_99_part_00
MPETTALLVSSMEALTAELDVIHAKFEPYVSLVSMEPRVHVEAFLAQKPDAAGIEAECHRLEALATGAETCLFDDEHFKMFDVKCDGVKKICARCVLS